MARTSFVALMLGLTCLYGCNSHEVNELRASLATQKTLAERARADERAATAKAARAIENAEAKLTQAAKLNSDAESKLAAARVERAAAAAAERAGKEARLTAESLHAEAQALAEQNELDRAELATQLIEARKVIEEAARAEREAQGARTVLAEVGELAAKARQDRASAQEALKMKKRVLENILAESKAALKEQQAAAAAVESARLQQEAAADAVEASRLAKQDIANARASLDHEREQLADAKQEVEQRSNAAYALAAKLERKKAAAEHASAEAIRQQVILAQQIAVLESVKEAADLSELAAQQARTQSSIERKAADKAAVTADAARREAIASFEYVRSVIQQLRDSRLHHSTSQENASSGLTGTDAKVADLGAVVE